MPLPPRPRFEAATAIKLIRPGELAYACCWSAWGEPRERAPRSELDECLLRCAAAADGGGRAIDADRGWAARPTSPNGSVEAAVVAGALASCEPDIVNDRGGKAPPSEVGRGTEDDVVVDEMDGGRLAGIAIEREETSPAVVIGLLVERGSVRERMCDGGGEGEDAGAFVKDKGGAGEVDSGSCEGAEGAGSSLVGRTTILPGVCIGGAGVVASSRLCIGGGNVDR